MIPTMLNPNASLPALKRTFAVLQPPVPASLTGTHRGQILGPPWQRALAGPLLTVCRLRGWWGKWFSAENHGQNLLLRHGVLQRQLPMFLDQRPSLIDGQPVTAVVYPPDAYWPWPLIVDELRRLDAHTCLGLTVFKPLRRASFAFLLRATAADAVGK
jgi:hypothetical protein